MKFSQLGHIVLASASVARAKVLRDIGLDVEVCPTETQEDHSETEPALVVELLARRKMDSFLNSHPDFDAQVLTCDTLISLNSELIGKPKDRDDALRQLTLFSGKVHQVYTGYCLYVNGKVFNGTDVCNVKFKELSDTQIQEYLESGQYIGAAGSYRIQGLAKAFIDCIDGDINTVIGLPLNVLEKLVI